MAISKQELKNWVDSIRDEDDIAIDDGGLALVVVGEDDIYLEIGGAPEGQADNT
jgi:hypothetical protein